MAAPQSLITTALTVDPPLSQNADYRMDANDRGYIDNQIRGLEQHAVDFLIGGANGSFFTVDGGSAALAVGDVFCTSGIAGTVTKATPSALAASGRPLGVVLAAANPGGRVKGAIDGLLSTGITGLTGTAGYARVSSAGRIERVSTLASTDYQIGTIDGAGNLSLQIGMQGGAAVGSLAGDVTGLLTATVVEKLTGAAGVVSFPIGNKITSTGGSNVGDVVTTSAGSLIFGNQSAATNVGLYFVNSASIFSSAAAAQLGLLATGAGAFVKTASETVRILKADNSTEGFRFDTVSTYFRLDSASGTFPTTGFIQFKNYGSPTTVIGWRHAGGDGIALNLDGTNQVVQVGLDTVTVGNRLDLHGYYGVRIASTGIGLKVQVPVTTGSVNWWTVGNIQNMNWDFVGSGGNMLLRFGENIIPTVKHDQATTANNGTKTTYVAQAAKSGSGGNGGDFEIQTGQFDGGGTGGSFILKTGTATTRLTVSDAGLWTVSANTQIKPSSGFVQFGDSSTTTYLGSSSIGVNVAAGTNVTVVYPTATGIFKIQSVGQAFVTWAHTDAGAGTITYDTASTSITWKQNDKTTNGGTGATTTIQAQNETGTTSNGGALVLTSGTGTTAAGTLSLQCGGVTIFATTPTAAVVQVNGLLFGNAVAAPLIGQVQIAAGAGVDMTIQPQAAGSGNNKGGDLLLTGGTPAGTGNNGQVKISTRANFGQKQYTFPSDANQTLSEADSQFNILNILAGVITAGRTITITRAAILGSLLFIRNNTAQTVTIQFTTGASITMATATSALVSSNGTDVVKIITAT